jgi:hypothetical protein
MEMDSNPNFRDWCPTECRISRWKQWFVRVARARVVAYTADAANGAPLLRLLSTGGWAMAAIGRPPIVLIQYLRGTLLHGL